MPGIRTVRRGIALIGVDWGTSNLRGWAYDAEGRIVDRASQPTGIAMVTDGAFDRVLRDLIGAWNPGDIPLLLGGMIGSRQGWHEVPYISCPARLEALAAGTLAVETSCGEARIVPGLSCIDARGIADVMRGEEVQLLGAGIENGIAVLPGTHSKWVNIEGGAIVSFRTFMTGELFALLKSQSLLGRLMAPGSCAPASFALGVDRALSDPALTALLFSVRTEGLFGRVPPTGLADYLSGMLIGAEIAAGLPRNPGPLTVIAAGEQAERYARAIAQAGTFEVRTVDGEAAASSGLLAIARQIWQKLSR